MNKFKCISLCCLWIYLSSIVTVDARANSTSVCGVGFFDTESGTISSPNYPNNYPANTRCVWIIDATPGYGIGIRFTRFDLQFSAPCNDYLSIGDGKSQSRSFCGRGPGTSREFQFRSRALRLEFVADATTELSGFSMNFRRIGLGRSSSTICGSNQLTIAPGSLIFPPFGSQYPPDVHCDWTIRALPGSLIRITFTEMSLEDSPRCLNDYLVIFDNGTQQGLYCGSTIPPNYTSQTSSVNLIFFSDSLNSDAGFSINWQVISGVCSTLPSTQHGQVTCSNDNRVGSVCQHVCDDGFQLIGNISVSVCVHDLNGLPFWTNNNRRCVASCTSNEVANATSSCTNGQSIDSICEYSCPDNYFLIGENSSTCVSQNSFQAVWNPPLPSCVGPPVPNAIMDFDVVPQDNVVTFTCSFAGFPLPDIEWRFENGTSLPITSQYQVSEQETISEYQTSRDLTVYGVACLNASLLRFRCFATNLHTATPVQSGVYATDLSLSYLQIVRTNFTCEEARSFCQNRGGSLAIVTTTAVLLAVNSESDSNYWISSLTYSYVSLTAETDSIESNPQGCIQVEQEAATWSRDQMSPASVVCEFRPNPKQPRASAESNICRGNVLNVSWSAVPGADSLTHYVFANNQRMVAPPGARSVFFDNLNGNTLYGVEVVPLFDGCEHVRSFSPNATTNVTTGRTGLLPVQNVQFIPNSEQNSCTVEWRDDLQQNRLQDINYYEITLTRKVVQQRRDVFLTDQPPLTIQLLHSVTEYTIIQLEPNTEYEVAIGSVPATPCAVVSPTVWSSPFQGICRTNPSAPESISLSDQAAYLKDNRIAVTLSPLDESRGPISCYILVVQRNNSKSSSVDSSSFENLKQAGDSVDDDDPFIAFVTSRVDSALEVLLGDESLSCCDMANYDSQNNCSLYSRNKRAVSPLIRAQNRRLEPGGNFNYYVIATVPSRNNTLFATSDVSMTFQQPSLLGGRPEPGPSDFGNTLLQNWFILIIIAVALLVIVVLIVILVVRRRKSQTNKHSFANVPRAGGTVNGEDRNLAVYMTPTAAGPPEPAYCEPFVQFTSKEFESFLIPKADLTSTFLTKSSDNNALFRKEFKKILTGIPTPCTKYARQPECRDKNRNEEFLPSDQSRVQLESIGSTWGSDYINASFVDGFVSHRAFIAAQGPMQNTVEDFWKMVLENHCTKIVMLTRLRENSRIKCDCYWADDGMKEDFGNISVTTKSVKNIGHFKQREFLVKPKNHPNSFRVTQYQFMTWPDHDVPTTTSSLLRFREAVLSDPSEGTILVHGSAGGGRTGTFLALLILCEQLDRCNEVNAVEALKKLRDGRTGMIENLKQYIYLHKLLCEISTLPVTDCLASEFPKYFARMKDVNSYHTTNMMTEFDQLDVLASLHDEPALAKCKPDKNSIKPYKRTGINGEHTLLQKGRKAITSLNLSEIQTYNPDVCFLTAPCPSKSKWQAFWNGVIQFNITCIIRIEEKKRCDQNFFTGEGDSFDDVSVSITKYEQHFGYIEKSIKLFKGGSSTPHCVQQIELNSWPINGFPPNFHTVVSVASRVRNHRPTSKQATAKKYLALVLCSDGSTRCGAFCAIFNLLDRLDRENRVDVFREVKDLRDCRTRMVGNIQQYEFLYQALAEYIEEFNPYQELK